VFYSNFVPKTVYRESVTLKPGLGDTADLSTTAHAVMGTSCKKVVKLNYFFN